MRLFNAENALEGIFGPAAKIIETKILSDVSAKFGVEKSSIVQYGFAEQLKALKKKATE